MALKFPDSITQNNSNYITVSATDNDVQGIYFVSTFAERDALGLADTVLDNHRVLKAVVYVDTVPYLFNGPDVSDAQWSNASNWVQVGGTDLSEIGSIGDVDVAGAADGDFLIYNGDTENWVLYNPESEVLIPQDFAYDIDTFSATDFVGAVYTYTLHDFGVGARTGQFMIVTDGTEIEFTDNTTNAIGTDVDEPELTAHLSGGMVVVRVSNGNGYTFKATLTQL